MILYIKTIHANKNIYGVIWIRMLTWGRIRIICYEDQELTIPYSTGNIIKYLLALSRLKGYLLSPDINVIPIPHPFPCSLVLSSLPRIFPSSPVVHHEADRQALPLWRLSACVHANWSPQTPSFAPYVCPVLQLSNILNLHRLRPETLFLRILQWFVRALVRQAETIYNGNSAI